MNWWHTHVNMDDKLHEVILGFISVIGMIYMLYCGIVAFMDLPTYTDYAHSNTCVQVSTRVVCGHPTP